MTERGKFIVVEGGVGSGKSTQLFLIGKEFTSRGVEKDWEFFREPGGTIYGDSVRNAVQGTHGYKVESYAALFGYLSARANLVRGKIIPRLENGKNVGLDRYRYSTEAYQTAEGIPFVITWALNQIATKGLSPNLVLHYDLAPEIGIQRKYKGVRTDIDRYDEMDIRFHKNVRKNYNRLRLVHPRIWRTIDASGSEEEVFNASWEALKEYNLV